MSTQGFKSKNFVFDFNKKLNPCLVESAQCYRNLAAAMFSANENHQRRETGTNNFVWKWPGMSNIKHLMTGPEGTIEILGKEN